MGEFIDMQAEVGISKHLGGLPATRRLLELCHAERATELLEVGCGTGAGTAYAARAYGCHIVGVGLSPKMIDWAGKRVHEASATDRVELRVADVLELPFGDGRFDAVLCESVLAFVPDKARAIREMVRVTRPAGHVGLNEGIWIGEVSTEAAETARRLGSEILAEDDWRALWDASGLEDRTVIVRALDPGAEVRSRLRWIGLSWAVRAWARALWLLATKPEIRRASRTVASGGQALESTGFALLVGTKPVAETGAGGRG